MYTVSLVNRVGIRGNGGARRIVGDMLRKLLCDFVNFLGSRRGDKNAWRLTNE